MTPVVILDNAPEGRVTRFAGARGAIAAREPGEVPAALDALEAARAAGRHLAGYFSYELGYLLEPRLAALLPERRAVPLLWFGVFDRAERADEGAFATAARAYAGPLAPEWDEAAYRSRFDRARAMIAAGEIYQANLSFRARFAFAGEALALYRALREQSAARHGAYIDDGERRILSLSPELFFDLAPDGRIVTRPMKGTAAPGPGAAARLAASVKDRAENLMIVDLLRNDLGRIAAVGSVAVENLFQVETYPTLHQMVSTVTARLSPGTGIAALLRAIFPSGSVTGAPKIAAMERLAALEASPRGVYCGAIGHFAPDGAARFNVAIRTLTISGGRGELGLGGAVVQDSESAGEYAECLLKTRYFAAARRPLVLIETLRFSPGEGFVRRGLHLGRMARSAAAFGIPFDAAKANEALQQAAAGEGDLRVRLTLDEEGRFDGTSAPLGPAPEVWRYAIAAAHAESADLLLRHKTGWRETFEREYERAHAAGADEVLFLNERGELAEGSRTSIFIRRGGRLLTPPLAAGALDGVLRRALIEAGDCEEAVLTPDDLSGETFLGNSLRGLIRAVPVMPA